MVVWTAGGSDFQFMGIIQSIAGKGRRMPLFAAYAVLLQDGVRGKGKVMFMGGEETLVTHFAQFLGHGAAVYVEIIGKLLSVEGYGKRTTPV